MAIEITGKRPERDTYRQTDRKTGRLTDRHTDREFNVYATSQQMDTVNR